MHLNDNKYITKDVVVNNRKLTVLDLSRTDLNFLHSKSIPSNPCFGFESLLDFIRETKPTTYFTDHLFQFIRDNDRDDLKVLQNLPSTATPILINLSGSIDKSASFFTSIDLMYLESAVEHNRRRYGISDWIINMNGNSFYCNCHTSEFGDLLRRSPESRPYLKNVQFIVSESKCNVLRSRLIKEVYSECELNYEICPQGCKFTIKMIDRLVVFDCSNAQLTQFPTLPNVQNITQEILRVHVWLRWSQSATNFESSINETLKYEFHVENNQINAWPGQHQEGYDRAYEIYAQNNSIDSISTEILPKNLTFLDLSHNTLTRVNSDVLRHLDLSDNFDKLALGNNPLACDCDSSDDILEFPRLHPKINYQNLICVDGNRLSNKRSECWEKSRRF